MSGQGKTIAWIEDDFDVIDPVTRPLKKAGYTIIPYRTIGEALNALDTLAQVDLILLDLIQPPGNAKDNFGPYPGKQLLKYLREHNIHVPVIIFTVLARESIHEELREDNVVDVIRKPVRPSELKRRVEAALAGQHSPVMEGT